MKYAFSNLEVSWRNIQKINHKIAILNTLLLATVLSRTTIPPRASSKKSTPPTRPRSNCPRNARPSRRRSCPRAPRAPSSPRNRSHARRMPALLHNLAIWPIIEKLHVQIPLSYCPYLLFLYKNTIRIKKKESLIDCTKVQTKKWVTEISSVLCRQINAIQWLLEISAWLLAWIRNFGFTLFRLKSE